MQDGGLRGRFQLNKAIHVPSATFVPTAVPLLDGRQWDVHGGWNQPGDVLSAEHPSAWEQIPQQFKFIPIGDATVTLECSRCPQLLKLSYITFNKSFHLFYSQIVKRLTETAFRMVARTSAVSWTDGFAPASATYTVLLYNISPTLVTMRKSVDLGNTISKEAEFIS
jgi:hypothetical protein